MRKIETFLSKINEINENNAINAINEINEKKGKQISRFFSSLKLGENRLKTAEKSAQCAGGQILCVGRRLRHLKIRLHRKQKPVIPMVFALKNILAINLYFFKL